MIMKRSLALILAASLAASSLCACSFTTINRPDHSADSSDSSAGSSAESDDSSADQAVILSKESGVYDEAIELELTGDGDIYYTLDGTDPRYSETRILYTEPFTVSDRGDAPNVFTAVSPTLFSANYSYVKDGKNICEKSAPSDEDVDKISVVRAVVEVGEDTFSAETVGTYLIGGITEHIPGALESAEAAGEGLAVINITINYDDMFDPEYGIYVKGNIFDKALADAIASGEKVDGEYCRKIEANYNQRGRDWERNAYIEMLEVDASGATSVISQNAGIRIQGNYSRSDLVKGFRLYARKSYGDGKFRYDVFGEECVDASGAMLETFDTLVLRAGGNCAFTSKFNDTYWQQLSSSLECATKRSRPAVVYINGEYWGLYVLEEDFTDDYFSDHYGVNKDDVIVHKGDAEKYSIGYSMDEGEVPEGEDVSYYFMDLLDFFASHDSLDDAGLEELGELVDLESLRDYFAMEVWINNKWDWPGKNWSMWRTLTDEEKSALGMDISADGPDSATAADGKNYSDSKWRFCIYDVEFGGVSGSGDATTNTIKEDNYKPNGLLDFDTKNPAVLCFAYAMTNESFREDYLAKLVSLGENEFAKDKALTLLENFENEYKPLYEQFADRFPGVTSVSDAFSGGYASSKCIRDFLAKRYTYIEKMVTWVNNKFK